jgi:transposase
LLEEYLRATREACYWRAMHRRAAERETQLKQRLAELEAKLRLREQQLFGRKTETASSTPPSTPAPATPAAAPRRPRGQQAGRPGHGRRDYSHLPATVEEAELRGDAGCCPRCHRPFEVLGGTEDSTVLEIAVRA